jgi:hypothetical protein
VSQINPDECGHLVFRDGRHATVYEGGAMIAADCPRATPTDTARLDWLNADPARLEEVFGYTVRNEHGGDVRAIIDAEMAESAARAAQEGRE